MNTRPADEARVTKWADLILIATGIGAISEVNTRSIMGIADAEHAALTAEVEQMKKVKATSSRLQRDYYVRRIITLTTEVERLEALPDGPGYGITAEGPLGVVCNRCGQEVPE